MPARAIRQSNSAASASGDGVSAMSAPLRLDCRRLCTRRARPATLGVEGGVGCARRLVSSAPVRPGCCCRICCTCRASNSVVLEARSRDYVENRIRAGVLEYGTEQLLNDSGVGERMRREGMLHPGVVMRFDRADHRIDFADLVGKHVMVYSQHKVVQDLIAARLAAGGQIVFEAEDVSVHDFQTGHAAHPLSARWRRARDRRATSSPAATGSMASAARRSPTACCACSSASIRSAGSAFSPRRRRRRRRTSMSAMSAASRCWRCARRR